ncbi:hypothetical protein [Bartonella apihabitans]|uniref:hypothetical protein n=1 Tax=Bartonella apihabitans TaxID=2750929 RepID=UPI001AECD88A|nr:hypothetical protein [Bartonella apihabitans]
MANERSVVYGLSTLSNKIEMFFVGFCLDNTLAKRFICWRELTVFDRVFPPPSGKAQDLDAL